MIYDFYYLFIYLINSSYINNIITYTLLNYALICKELFYSLSKIIKTKLIILE